MAVDKMDKVPKWRHLNNIFGLKQIKFGAFWVKNITVYTSMAITINLN